MAVLSGKDCDFNGIMEEEWGVLVSDGETD